MRSSDSRGARPLRVTTKRGPISRQCDVYSLTLHDGVKFSALLSQRGLPFVPVGVSLLVALQCLVGLLVTVPPENDRLFLRVFEDAGYVVQVVDHCTHHRCGTEGVLVAPMDVIFAAFV